jgi:hypothetical protein
LHSLPSSGSLPAPEFAGSEEGCFEPIKVIVRSAVIGYVFQAHVEMLGYCLGKICVQNIQRLLRGSIKEASRADHIEVRKENSCSWFFVARRNDRKWVTSI